MNNIALKGMSRGPYIPEQIMMYSILSAAFLKVLIARAEHKRNQQGN